MLLSDTLTVMEVVVAGVMIVEDAEVEGATTAAQIHIMVEIMVVINPTNNNLTSLAHRLKAMGAIVKAVDHTPSMVGKVMAHLEVLHQVEAALQTPNITPIVLEGAMAHRVVLIAGTMAVMVDKETVRAEAMMPVEEVTVEEALAAMAAMADKQQTAMEGTVGAFR